MSLKPAKVQFNGGELSPWLQGRSDIAKYDKTAKLCRNFIPMAEGSLKRRGGTRFVELTPEDVEFKFEIVTVPAEAVVLINGVEQRYIFVARGDKVNFEVRADGYSSQAGAVVVGKNTVMKISLISKSVMATLEIDTVPQEAVVKIDGIERNVYQAPLNKQVRYLVSKNGYIPKSGKILMNADKNITVRLQQEEEEVGSGTYGDWGTPLYFVDCTAVGWAEKQKKCFCFRFTNGYLAVIFDANLKCPVGAGERVFFEVDDDGYDSVAYKNGRYYLTCLNVSSNAYRYTDLNGKAVVAFDKGLTMKTFGWQLDEEGYYASFYRLYSGSVFGVIGKVYYDGELIWKLYGGQE